MNNKDLWKNAENIKIRGPKPSWNFGNNWKQAGLITLCVTTLCIFVFIIELIVPNTFGLLTFYSTLSFENFLAKPWKLITPSFMHGDWVHLAFNLVIWWLSAQVIEARHGKMRLLLILLLTAAISNIAQFYVSGPFFLGLSGVVMGAVSYCVSFTYASKSVEVELSQPVIIAMLISLLFGLIFPSQIANIAHITGAITGAALGFIFARIR